MTRYSHSWALHDTKVQSSRQKSAFLRFSCMSSCWVVSLQRPAVVRQHDCVPPPLVLLLHLVHVLIEPFSLLVTHRPKVFRKLVQVHPSFWKAYIMLLMSVAWFAAFVFPRKLFTTCTNDFQVALSSVFMEFRNSVSFMSCRICGPSKMPALSSAHVVEAPPIFVQSACVYYYIIIKYKYKYSIIILI